MSNPTITDVVRHVDGLSTEQVTHLSAALIEREDTIADQLRMAGMQFGLFPQIVAEVLAEVGLGTPPSPEARQEIRNQFTALMEEIQRQQGMG
jgi:hypothetical protein